jgi:four helix bundle protein
MFDFEKLEVYKKIRETQRLLYPVVSGIAARDSELGYRLREASLDVALRLVEGTGRYTTEDKKRLYAESRSALFELVALFQVASDQGLIGEAEYDDFYDRFEQISKMMLGMIRTRVATDRLEDE